MPGWLAKALIAAYGVWCLAFQARLSLDWLNKEAEESQRARRPFSVRNFDAQGLLDFVLPEARAAGLARGDRIVAVDGAAYTGSGGYFRALDTHQAGEILRLRVRRGAEPAERDVAITLRVSRDAGDSWSPRDLVNLGITQILTPLTALGLGLLVAIRRPRETLAWIVFAFLISFSILATGGLSHDPVRMVSQWEPWMRVPALAHMALWLYLWPMLLAMFAIYFPYRAEWDGARPWLKWLLIVPASLHALIRAVAFPAAVEALPDYRELVRLADTLLHPKTFAYFGAVCILAAFAEGARKLRAAGEADTRRRLRILLAGSALALLPFLAAVFAQDLFGVRATGWAMTAAAALLIVFPITLVYLILVERALDLGVTVREGLQYTLARRGLYVVQFLLILGLTFGLGVSLGEPGLRLAQRIQRVAYGIGAAMLARRAVEVGARWVDRRFFREQYQAGQLLTELAQQVGETADRDRLRELVTSRIASTLHTAPVHLIDHETSAFAGTLSRLSQERRPQWVDWVRPSDWMRGLDTPEAARLRALQAELLLPVARQDRLLGFLALGPRRSEQPYSSSDVAVLESVASQTALSLDNARLAETVASETASREILNRELQIARDVQERLLPRQAPQIPGLDVAGLCVPAREVGGDSFDYLALPGGEWALAIGDVAGKGVSASLLMASLQASVRGLAADGIADLPELMARLNRLMYEATPSNRFATFLIGVFNPATRRMRLCGAGHNPALRLARGGAPEWLRPRGVALGLVKEARYTQMELTLAPGDLLLFYTDGVTEAMNPASGQFGEDRLAEWAKLRAGSDSATVLARDLVRQVQTFAGEAPQHDDITIIAMRVQESILTATAGSAAAGR